MLEGQEFKKEIGQVGEVTVDVTPELVLEVKAGVKVDLLAELKKLADKTATPYDNMALEWVEKLLKAGAALAK
jgi:hypothetical protein